MKGLRVEILNGPHTNKVPFDHLTLVGEGVDEVFTATDEAPPVAIVAGNLPGTLKAIVLGGKNSLAAFLAPAGGNGPMGPLASGAYIDSTDSRFRRLSGGHPVPLHNRYEA